MYTKQKVDDDIWNILDPQGDDIGIHSLTELEADILISHLNREN